MVYTVQPARNHLSAFHMKNLVFCWGPRRHFYAQPVGHALIQWDYSIVYELFRCRSCFHEADVGDLYSRLHQIRSGKCCIGDISIFSLCDVAVAPPDAPLFREPGGRPNFVRVGCISFANTRFVDCTANGQTPLFRACSSFSTIRFLQRSFAPLTGESVAPPLVFAAPQASPKHYDRRPRFRFSCSIYNALL